MRSVSDKQLIEITKAIISLPNASSFTFDTRIDVCPVSQDNDSLEFAKDLQRKLKDSGHRDVRIDIAPLFGSFPAIPFAVYQSNPSLSFPIVFIYPQNGWTSERNPDSPFFNETYTTAFIKKALSSLTVQEITRKISRFRELDYNVISNDELLYELTNVLSSIHNVSIIPVNLHHHFHKGAQLFRIRRWPESDTVQPKTFKATDAWNPPVAFITKPGRLNQKGESLLYVASSAELAGEEMRVIDGENIALIVYEAQDEIRLNMVGHWYYSNLYTEDENFKIELFYNFFRNEFTRPVGVGTEYLYRLSELIAKEYFDMPRLQDAWCYPSAVKKKNGVNLCLRPDKASKLLKVIAVVLGKVKRRKDGIFSFSIDGVVTNSTESSSDYFPVGSDKFEEIFSKIDPDKGRLNDFFKT